MKIHFVSDLHLEFGYQELPGGEVLILAGDVAEAHSIRKHFHSTRLVSDEPVKALACSEFFAHEVKKYKKVFYVMGNHEHYNGRFDKTWHELADMMPDNVSLLECQSEEYEGVLFVGATLWTDCDKGRAFWDLRQGMNDYRLITNYYPATNTYYKLTPEHTAEVHKKTKDYLRQVLAANPDKQIVVITHHAPTMASIDVNRYGVNNPLNAGYASDISDIILDHPNIKFWIHGHIHTPVDYMVGETRVVSNPRGYHGYDANDEFEPDWQLEL